MSCTPEMGGSKKDKTTTDREKPVMTVNPEDLQEVNYEAECTVTDLGSMYEQELSKYTSVKTDAKPKEQKDRKDDNGKPKEQKELKELKDRHKERKTKSGRKPKPPKDREREGKITVERQKVAPITVTNVVDQPQPSMVTKKVATDKPVPIVIAIGSKKGHKLENVITGNSAYVVERTPGLTLKLRRGRLYRLKFAGDTKSGYKLMFTESPSGGTGAAPLKGTPIVAVGTQQDFMFGADVPSVFYYQDCNHQFMGGVITMAEQNK